MELKGNKVIVGFSKANSLHKDALEAKQNMDVVEGVLKDFTEKELRVIYEFSDTLEENREPSLDYEAEAEKSVSQKSNKMEPIVRNAIEKFEGKIVKQYYVKE